MFISPTEPKALREMGATNSVPETFGVDVLFQSEMGLVGVQRKQFPSDFLASVHDGRLNREFAQMRPLKLAILLLEGKERWTTDGMLIRERNDKRNGWNRHQHRNYLASVQMRGIQVAHSDSLADTITYIHQLQVWCNKPDHTGLDTRPAARGDNWGNIENVDYQLYFLQSLPGVGPKQARAIIDTLGFPFRLIVTEDELMGVPGIGKVRAKNIVEVLTPRVKRGKVPDGA